MNAELRELFERRRNLLNYPQAFEKISSGEWTYDDFQAWVGLLVKAEYFNGKVAFVAEYQREIDFPERILKTFKDEL